MASKYKKESKGESEVKKQDNMVTFVKPIKDGFFNRAYSISVESQPSGSSLQKGYVYRFSLVEPDGNRSPSPDVGAFASAKEEKEKNLSKCWTNGKREVVSKETQCSELFEDSRLRELLLLLFLPKGENATQQTRTVGSGRETARINERRGGTIRRQPRSLTPPSPLAHPRHIIRRRHNQSRRRNGPLPAIPETISEEAINDVEEVEYEPITDEDISRANRRRRPREWRVIPTYSLNSTETIEQEIDLYKSFQLGKGRSEEVRPSKKDEIACCVCYENQATRVVVPCGHQCLCYSCARNIAFNRTLYYGSRVAKLCPICQAAISIMPRLVES